LGGLFYLCGDFEKELEICLLKKVFFLDNKSSKKKKLTTNSQLRKGFLSKKTKPSAE
jgi:hypothetical protein